MLINRFVRGYLCVFFFVCDRMLKRMGAGYAHLISCLNLNEFAAFKKHPIQGKPVGLFGMGGGMFFLL